VKVSTDDTDDYGLIQREWYARFTCCEMRSYAKYRLAVDTLH